MPRLALPTEYGAVILASMVNHVKPIILTRTGEVDFPWVGWDNDTEDANAWKESAIDSWRLWVQPGGVEITEDEIREAILNASGFPPDDEDIEALKTLFDSKRVSNLEQKPPVAMWETLRYSSLKNMSSKYSYDDFLRWIDGK